MCPRDIRQIRRGLNANQAFSARFLNVSPNTIRIWEQGTRRPRGADLKLLSIAKKNSKAFLSAKLTVLLSVAITPPRQREAIAIFFIDAAIP
jgi:transcriptional regulator with XRE-family HTH domain